VGPCASGVYEVGKEAGTGGGGLQRCVAEVDCVVWRRAIPHSGGRFGVRRPFCGSWRPHVRLAAANVVVPIKLRGVTVLQRHQI